MSEHIRELEEEGVKLNKENLFICESLLIKSGELRDANQANEFLRSHNAELTLENLRLEKLDKLSQDVVNGKNTYIDFLTGLLKEERDNRVVLYERIQEFAGLKERTFVAGEQKEAVFKGAEVKHGRRAVIDQLEKRSQDLLKKQRDEEAERIRTGELAPEPVVIK